MRRYHLIPVSLLLLAICAARGEEGSAPPSTVTVTRGAFAAVATLEGAFDGVGAIEVRYEPRVFTGSVKIREAVPVGPVEKGRRLVVVDLEPIDVAIADAERDRALARASLAASAAEEARREEAARIALKQASEEARVAADSLRIFREIERPLRLAQADQSIESSKDRIRDQTEELEQLEKMYLADDLTEETEEIVLRRARRDLARTKRWHEFSLTRDKLLREVELPRELRGKELAAERSAFALGRLEATTGPSLERARVEMEKARAALTIRERKLERLRADRAALEILSPEAGIAVPGRLVRGKWSGIENARKVLRRGGKLPANDVLYTIVRPGTVEIVTTVPEARIRSLRGGLLAVVTPTADPGAKLAATVTSVAAFSADGKYELRLSLAAEDGRILPGHTCKIELTLAEKAGALTVPTGSIRIEGKKTFLFRLEDGKPKRVEVETGGKSADRTEILSGVSEGDVLLETPPEKK